MAASMYEVGLDRNAANFVQQSPLTFIERSAQVYPDRLAVIHGATRRTWSQMYARCRQLAAALTRVGVKRFDTVAVMLPITVSGIGVREIVMIGCFAIFGLGREAAVAQAWLAILMAVPIVVLGAMIQLGEVFARRVRATPPQP